MTNVEHTSLSCYTRLGTYYRHESLSPRMLRGMQGIGLLSVVMHLVFSMMSM